MFNQMSHLSQRLIVGLVSLAFILVALYFSPYAYFRPIFVLMNAAVIGMAVWEYYQMAKGRGVRPLKTLGVLGTVVYTVAVYWSTQSPGAFLLPEIILGLIVFTGFLHFLFRQGHPFLDLAVTFFAILYLTIPLSFLININYYFPLDADQDGRWWLFFLLLTTKITDTGAFFCGRAFGRRKLAPEISPKKTWEGAVAGGISALISAGILYIITDAIAPTLLHGLSLGVILGLAAVLSLVAQIGDLAESALKRDTGVKDSNQLPGLGGILDVVDSLVFTTPIVYIFLKLIYP